MPRKPKSKVDSAVAVSDTLDTLKEEIPALKSASELPAQFPPPEPTLERFPRAEQEPPYREVVTRPERDTVRKEAAPRSEAVGEHTAAVLAGRPKMQPAPAGFMGVASHPAAGIRVSKSHDKRVAAIQFADDRLPTRAEKDILERVGESDDGKNFVYRTERRQWERPAPDGMALGENVIDATRIAEDLAKGRGERGR